MVSASLNFLGLDVAKSVARHRSSALRSSVVVVFFCTLFFQMRFMPVDRISMVGS